MDVRDQAVLDALRRVIVFCEKPWESLQNVNQGFRDQVAAHKAATLELSVLAGEHRQGMDRNAIEEENFLVKVVYKLHLLPTLRVARAIGRTVPGIQFLSEIPKRFTKENILATAKAVFTASAQHEGTLVSKGLPADFRIGLEGAIRAVEEKQYVSESHRNDMVRITKAIESAFVRARNALFCIDPVVRLMCGCDPVYGAETLRAWESARRVHKVPPLPSNVKKRKLAEGKTSDAAGKAGSGTSEPTRMEAKHA
jgi:hypothetical protein